MHGDTPATVMKIPKYLTPADKGEIRMAYPTMVKHVQNRMNGPRSMIRSDTKAVTIVVMNPTTYGGTDNKFADAPENSRAVMIVGVKSAREYKGSAMEMYL